MCGICGAVWHPPGSLTARQGLNVLERLAHRGPDDRGILYMCGDDVAVEHEARSVDDVQAALFHTRLSILDLTSAGWQPMTSADGRYHLVFNGEIYNYVELRTELEAAGHTRFASHGDTEVLLEGFARWGVGFLERIVGMFAFAVLDAKRRRLILARDPFGIKPLYYASKPGGFFFASEIKALLTLPDVSRRVNAQRAYDYLRHAVTDFGGETMFADISQVPPGHILELSLDRPAQVETIPFASIETEERDDLSFDEAAQQLRRLFLKSVELHMRSDVPVGSALSGGIDSSAIVCAMRHLYPDAELHAFSFVAGDPALSEEAWIDLVGSAAGARVHKVRSDPEKLVDELEELIWTQEEPFVSTSIYAQYRVFRAARDAGIKVMLDGQGADELFGGYKLHLAARLASLIRRGKLVDAVAFLRRLAGHPAAGGWSQQLAYTMGMLLPMGAQRPLMEWSGRNAEPNWLDADWFDARGVQRLPHYWHAASPYVLKELARRTFEQTSLPMLLRYEDRNSMASSIESRVPFLTPDIARFVFSLPESYLIDERGVTKSVLRRSLAGLVPDAVLQRMDKIGFVTNQREWLQRLGPWVDDVLTGETASSIPLFDLDEMARSLAAIREGRSTEIRTLWRWINFVRWADYQNVEFD